MSPLAVNTGRGDVTVWGTLELSVLLEEAGRRGKLYLQSPTHLGEGRQPSPAPSAFRRGGRRQPPRVHCKTEHGRSPTPSHRIPKGFWATAEHEHRRTSLNLLGQSVSKKKKPQRNGEDKTRTLCERRASDATAVAKGEHSPAPGQENRTPRPGGRAPGAAFT